ncbi:hypothetical protein E2C01_010472 [Portunus trituberculatus]|uniref:Uncharacterized protein n=1 Tax=Portunus trituberculatus TaxID=210409 RepID=A0A5B7D8I6_PORTR|nr:hypothetical protein [Portunus trituberculatus]
MWSDPPIKADGDVAMFSTRYLTGMRQAWHSTAAMFSAPLNSRLTAFGDGPMDRGGGARYYVYCSRNTRAARQTPNKRIYFCELFYQS